ncbi:hypothetical protein ATY75_13320 [Rhizobium sp. N122]|uniref:glycoside hydrolase family 25 protein n=1 Tax=Rhizobium sp. N122 TaxID=1764272 RepID=UPI000B69A480|nr:GH25 family lysozyme [Rhizobium sp. N122]OWV61410.1 hypothetical protein ATY75_13320 [Rhizobium sp. N122]
MKQLLALIALAMMPCDGLAQEVDEFSRQELFAAVRLSTPGETALSFSRVFDFTKDTRDGDIFGIDTSHHTEDGCKCELNWNAILKQKVGFVYLKATEGTSYTDPTFTATVGRIRKANPSLPIGAYHFLSKNVEAKKQAEHFIAAVGQLGEMQLPPSLDLEWNLGPDTFECPTDAKVSIKTRGGKIVQKCDQWAFVSSEEIIARANAWIDHVKGKLGRDPLVYTNGSWWRSRVGASKRLDRLHTKLIWIADYSKSGLAREVPSVPQGADWHLWQFTDTASLQHGDGGIITVDASTFRGDSDEFATALGIPH